MDELLVTLEMLEIKYFISANIIVIYIDNYSKEVILVIVEYLNLYKFKWTYVIDNIYNFENYYGNEYIEDATKIYIKKGRFI